MLAAYARCEPHRVLFAGILSGIGVRDERIFQAVVAECRGEPSFCDMLGTYGDPRGLLYVLHELERARVRSPLDAGTWCELGPAFDAVEKLGGTLSLRLRRIRDGAKDAYERHNHLPRTLFRLN